MNNEKIGKFIRKLRKAKGLTQQQLGDLVNVGGKSVSKWERGLNMPDISIINEVSKILGITSDELLKGEFNRKSNNEEFKKKKNQRKTRILLFILIMLTTAITTILLYHFKNDTHKYWIASNSPDFNVDGYIEYNKKSYTINIDNIYCKLEECKNNDIKNIEYSLSLNGTILYMNGNDYEEIKKVTLNEYLYSKKILLTNSYNKDNLTYNDMKKGTDNISILIEYITYSGHQEHVINLKIDDKNR